MASPLFIIERLVTDKILQASTTMTGRPSVGHGLLISAGLFTLTGAGFLIFAAHLWLGKYYEPDFAAAMTGLISFGIALIIAAVAAGLVYFKRSMAKKVNAEVKKTIEEVFEVLDGFIGEPVREHPKTAALTAALTGFLVGERTI